MEKAVLDSLRFDTTQRELLAITARMLHAIHTGDSESYAALCLPDLTCFEDVCPYRIDGIEFHTALIEQMAANSENAPARFDMVTPHVQVYGATGIVTYTRLMTYNDMSHPRWTTCNETRVFIRRDDVWKMAHFHRSIVT